MDAEYLLQQALQCSERSLEAGALVPLETSLTALPSAEGSVFELRHLRGATPKHLRTSGPKPNPFRPWDSRLAVAPIGEQHMLILNKYPVQRGHMLLITQEWSPQSGWLGLEDWAALAEVDQDTSGLWFFNSGPAAGASQPHRHLQLLPRSTNEKICPRQQWFLNALEPDHQGMDDPLRRWSRVANVRERNAQALHQAYLSLCLQLRLGAPDCDPAPRCPYNLLLGRRWMALIRRSVEGVAGFSVNALGFAGCLLSTDVSDLNWLRVSGPEALLRAVVPGDDTMLKDQ